MIHDRSRDEVSHMPIGRDATWCRQFRLQAGVDHSETTKLINDFSCGLDIIQHILHSFVHRSLFSQSLRVYFYALARKENISDIVYSNKPGTLKQQGLFFISVLIPMMHLVDEKPLNSLVNLLQYLG